MFSKLRLFIVACFFGLTCIGCMKFDPKLRQKINNNGEIDEIKSNQNGIMLELGKLKQAAEIHDSELRETQQGVINLNAAMSRNENSGTQILQGDGPLVLIFGLGVVAMLLYYFHNKAAKAEQTVKILANEIERKQDFALKANILRAGMYTQCEKEIFDLFKPQGQS